MDGDPTPSMQMRGPNTDATVSPIAVLLVVAVSVGLGGTVLWGASLLTNQNVSAHPAIIRPVDGVEGYEVKMHAGKPVPLDQSYFNVEIDGTAYQVPLSQFAAATQDGNYWYAGETMCIVGTDPDCYAASGTDVQLELIVGESLTAEQNILVDPQSPGSPTEGTAAFAVISTGVQVNCYLEPSMKVLGTNLRHGKSGPAVDVLLEVDEGDGYRQLFGWSAIQAGWTAGFEIEANAVLALQGTADYGNQQQVYAPPSDHVLLLVDGDSASEVDTDELVSFLEPYIDEDTATVTLADDQVLVLYEFTESLKSALADYQDAALLLDFDATEC